MGGILTMPQFLNVFPSINPSDPAIAHDESLKAKRSETQGIAVASYNLGCFLGAIISIFISDRLGRKRMIMLGTSIMVVGAILQVSSPESFYSPLRQVLGPHHFCMLSKHGLNPFPIWQLLTLTCVIGLGDHSPSPHRRPHHHRSRERG